MNRALIVLALCGCATSATKNWPTGDALATSRFNRVVASWAEDGRPQCIVQTASTFYGSPDGQRSVTLVATVHLGTPEYFASLESALRDADAIWCEGVTRADGGEAESTDCPEPIKPIREYYDLLAEVSGLSNQKDWETGIRDSRWRNADADIAQLDALYAADNPADWDAFRESLASELARLRARSSDGVSEEERREERFGLIANVSGHSDPEGGWRAMNEQRDRAAWEIIRAGLGTGRHAILFGAAHGPALEARLVEAGYVRRSTTWHDVFAVDAPMDERWK